MADESRNTVPGHFGREPVVSGEGASTNRERMVEAQVVIKTAENGMPYARNEVAWTRLPQSLLPPDFLEGLGGVQVFQAVAHSPAYLARCEEQDRQKELERGRKRQNPKLQLIEDVSILRKQCHDSILQCQYVAEDCEAALYELEAAQQALLECEQSENDNTIAPSTPKGTDFDTANVRVNSKPLGHSSSVLTALILEAELQPVEKIQVWVECNQTRERRIAYFPKTLFPPAFWQEFYFIGEPTSVDLGLITAYSVPYIESEKRQEEMAKWWREQGPALWRDAAGR